MVKVKTRTPSGLPRPGLSSSALLKEAVFHLTVQPSTFPGLFFPLRKTPGALHDGKHSKPQAIQKQLLDVSV